MEPWPLVEGCSQHTRPSRKGVEGINVPASHSSLPLFLSWHLPLAKPNRKPNGKESIATVSSGEPPKTQSKGEKGKE